MSFRLEEKHTWDLQIVFKLIKDNARKLHLQFSQTRSRDQIVNYYYAAKAPDKDCDGICVEAYITCKEKYENAVSFIKRELSRFVRSWRNVIKKNICFFDSTRV